MRWTIIILAFLLSGCVAHYQARYQTPPPMLSTSMAQVNAMVGEQQPVAYKVGFRDGCDSGYLSAGNNSYIFKKDVERFNTDQVYQQGWNDGFNRCASGEGLTTDNTSVSGYYGWGYYPGLFYSGFYYPNYYYYPYYSPGFSIWLGNYGHRHYAYRDHYYYAPWYSGRKYKSGPRGPYIGKPRGSYYGGKPYIGKRGGGSPGRSYKGRGSKGRSHTGGGFKGRPYRGRGR